MENKYLCDIDWLTIGSTDYYNNLKEDISYVCDDISESGSIKEVAINDILQTFRLHGFEVVQRDPTKIDYSLVKEIGR